MPVPICSTSGLLWQNTKDDMKSLLRHRCTIERATIVDNDGVETKSFIPHQKKVRCLLQEKRGMIVKLPSGEEIQAFGILYLPRNTDILPRRGGDTQDRIVMTRPSSPGGSFLVVFVSDRAGRGSKQGFLNAVVQRFIPDVPPLPI